MGWTCLGLLYTVGLGMNKKTKRTFKCAICAAVLVVLPTGELIELVEGRRLKQHIHIEQSETSHSVGRTVIANEASATATGANLAMVSFSGPDLPRLQRFDYGQSFAGNSLLPDKK